MELPWSPVISSFGLVARSVNMQPLPLEPFFVFIKVSAYSPEAKNCLTSFHYVLNSAPFDVFLLIISLTVSPARSLETMPALGASCLLIFTGKCLIACVSASKKS
jgi:hypothetical protein